MAAKAKKTAKPNKLMMALEKMPMAKDMKGKGKKNSKKKC